MEQMLGQVIKDAMDQEQGAMVLLGPAFKIPSAQEEHDVVVVFKRLKLILCTESKTTLNSKAIRSSMIYRVFFLLVPPKLGYVQIPLYNPKL